MADRLADLYSLLQQADGVQRPDSDLSWMWSEPGAGPFLEWIVNNVNSKCVLTQDQLNEYQRLDSSGRIVDSMIVKQHARVPKGAEGGEPIFNSERIANDVSILSRQQRLSMEILSSGRLKHAKLSSKLHSAKQRCEQAQRHVADQQSQLNIAFQDLISAMNSTSDVIHDAEQSIIKKQLDEYFETDNLFLNNIKAAFDSLRLRRREIEGMVLLPEKSHQENVEELERIKSIYAISERQRIDSHIVLAEAKAEQNFVGSNTYDEKSVQKLCNDLEQQFNQLYSERLQPLLERLAKYQKTTVLRGDYLLKIARQQDYLRAQNHILLELIRQRARHSLLFSAFGQALSDQKKFVTVISSLESHLDKIEAETERFKSTATEQTSLDDRRVLLDSDRAGLAVETALCAVTGEKPSSLLVTYDRIAKIAKLLVSSVAALESDQERFRSDHSHILSKRVNEAISLFDLLTISSTTCQPTLSHRPLLQLASKVQQLMEHLKDKIAVLQVEESSKRKALSDDENLQFERDIFIHFFQNPTVLEEDARKLCLRLKSF